MRKFCFCEYCGGKVFPSQLKLVKESLDKKARALCPICARTFTDKGAFVNVPGEGWLFSKTSPQGKIVRDERTEVFIVKTFIRDDEDFLTFFKAISPIGEILWEGSPDEVDKVFEIAVNFIFEDNSKQEIIRRHNLLLDRKFWRKPKN